MVQEKRFDMLMGNYPGIEGIPLIGWGKEGVVFQKNETVIKIFDGWTSSQQDQVLPLLQDAVASFASSDFTWVPDDLKLFHESGYWQISYFMPESDPYQGGYEKSLIEMINDLKCMNWLYLGYRRNSFRITGERLILTDWGMDFQYLDGYSLRENAWRAWAMINENHCTSIFENNQGFNTFLKEIGCFESFAD